MLLNFLISYALMSLALMFHIGASVVMQYTGAEIFGTVPEVGAGEVVIVTVLALILSTVHDFRRHP
jgi:hypothetical protein